MERGGKAKRGPEEDRKETFLRHVWVKILFQDQNVKIIVPLSQEPGQSSARKS